MSGVCTVEEALVLFESGCLSAAAALLQKPCASNKAGNEEALALYEKICKLKQEANQPKVQYEENAISSEASKLIARNLERQSQNRRHGLDENDRNVLLSFDQSKIGTFLISRGYTALYIESCNTRESMKANMMQSLLYRNDRVSGWHATRDGLRRCPFVSLFHGQFELNDVTATVPPLVRTARLLEDPQNEEDDNLRAESILQCLHHTEEELDIPSIRWWAAFLLLDAKRWAQAKEIIQQVLSDCTVAGRWPGYYLPEALFLASMAEFGLENRELCKQYLDSYFDLAEPLDRNRADATLLHLWAKKQKPPRPPTLQFLCVQALNTRHGGGCATKEADYELPLLFDGIEKTLHEDLPKLREALYELWDDHTFSHFTWLRVQVSKRLGIEEKDPYVPIKEIIEKSWEKFPCNRLPKHVESHLERLENSCGRTITVRHWEPKKWKGNWE